MAHFKLNLNASILIAGLLPAVLVGCGQAGGPQTISAADSDQTIAMSVLNTVGASARTMEPSVATSSSLTATTSAQANVCAELQVPSACSNGQSSLSFSKCGTQGSSSLDGKWIETFSPAQACDVQQSSLVLVQNSSLVKTAKLMKVLGTTANALISSDASTNFDGTTHSGGISISNSSGSITVSILGIHKQITTMQGAVMSDYNLHSDTYPMSIVGTRAAGTRSANGFVGVTDNTAHSNLTVTLANVMWTSPLCCYPTTGTIKVDHTALTPATKPTATPTVSTGAATSSTLTFDGNSCGQATLQSGPVTSTVTMSLCEE